MLKVLWRYYRKNKQMNIVIIGSKGFIGSHCSNYFKSQGHHVIGCDVVDSNEKNYFLINSLENNFTKLFKNEQVDFCINASGSANVSYSYEYPEKDFELNVSLVINILAAIKSHCLSCKFINFSSAAVYGNPLQLPIKEDSELRPLSPYGYHKMLSEKLLLEYHRFFNLKTCSLRVFSAYGPGLRKQLFWDIYQKTRLNTSINLFGTGEESRDFIYISDLVKAVDCIMAKAEFKGEAINIASGDETSIFQVANEFLNQLSINQKLIFNGAEKSGDPKNWRANISLLTNFGFKPKVSIYQGIKEYSLWLLNHQK